MQVFQCVLIFQPDVCYSHPAPGSRTTLYAPDAITHLLHGYSCDKVQLDHVFIAPKDYNTRALSDLETD